MEVDRQCILVLIGATPEGSKELIGFQTGFRESGQSWTELLTDLKSRGLSAPPELAISAKDPLERLGFLESVGVAIRHHPPSAVLGS
jgi:transposase-like protein